MKAKPLLFLDTSILLAAVFSSTGGSSVILDFARNSVVSVIITHRIINEAQRKLKQKYGSKELERLFDHLWVLRKSIKPSPANKEIERFNNLIDDKEDRHVLAGAKMYGVNYLITLDKHHFFTEKLEQAVLNFEIWTPQTFLNEFRKQSIKKK